MIWYLDTSAAMKFLTTTEARAEEIRNLAEEVRPTMVSTYLLETELRRAARRVPDVGQDKVSAFLSGVKLLEMPPLLFRKAGLIDGPNLRSLDALHLAGASMSGADCLVTYDFRLAEAGREIGLDVLTP